MKNKKSDITTKQIVERLNIKNLLNVKQLDFDLEIANSAIAMFGAYIVSIITTISMLIVQPGEFLTISSVYPTIAMPFFFLFFDILFKDIDSVIARNLCVIFMISIGPEVYFLTGSLGLGAIWMIFTYIFTITGIKTRISKFYIILESIVYTISIVLGLNGKVPITHISDAKIIALTITGLLQVSFFTIFVISFQDRILRKVITDLSSAKEDLTAYSEELIAQNREIQEINMTLANTKDELQESLEKQRVFSAAMHHELRNPLNGIMGATQVLLNDSNISEEQSKIIRIANTSATSLLGIVNDLLDYSKVEAGKFEIHIDKISLSAIKEKLIDTFRIPTWEKGLALEITMEENCPDVIKTDGGRIYQILVNFISNSVKYTKSGFVKANISIENNILHLCVKDSGEGISDEAKKVLFIPYTRINEEKHGLIQGTGLGLYIVKSIVTALNGNINVESEVGKGSTFLVDIPIEVCEEENKEDSSSNKISNTIHDFSNTKILSVDDSKINLHIFRSLLEKTGAKVDCRQSGKDALALLREQDDYDLIFLDHLMPEMDGVELYKEIRKLGITVPIFILTANADKSYEDLYRETGFTAKLDKPVQVQELYSLIEKYV
ncbi:MAG: response regulator [Eubacteriales bacterium]|nr:response regulator [Eubacteriales bacterium]